VKTIDTLVQDIYALLDDEAHLEVDPTVFGDEMKGHLSRVLSSREHGRNEPKLYASEYGDKCLRRLVYKVHTPEEGEALEPHTRFKFMYGDLLESTVLALAEAAGHTVTHKQERIEMANGAYRVSGRTDAIIDGHMVDVKTMSTYAFAKYKLAGGVTADTDDFGYRWQIGFYHHHYNLDKPPYFLGIDKQNGHIALFPVPDLPTKEEVEAKAAEAYTAVYPEGSLELPPRGYSDVPEGKSGNTKLDIACSYCAFKRQCWPGLRTFLYSRGPVFFTHVAKEPNVPEASGAA
jgi:hypothetical protein